MAPEQSAATVSQTKLLGARVAAPGEVPARQLHLSELDESRRFQSPSKQPGYCVDELFAAASLKQSLWRISATCHSCSLNQCCAVRSARAVPVKLPPSLPFEGESSYRTEYCPKPLPPPVKQAEVKLPPSLPFQETTAYRSDYGPKPLPHPVKPAEVKLPPSLPFEANSSYRSDYGVKPLPKNVPAPPVKLPPSLPFEGTSAYRDEYVPKPLPKPPAPQEVKLPPSLPFEGDTIYRSEFVRKENPVCQVSRMPPYPQPKHPYNHVFWDKNEKTWY
ncbi:hypothetical protein Efla_005786 [Eimeria flavescens]